MRWMLCITSALLLVGCSTAKPYAEVGIGYRIDQNSDWYLRSARPWTCKHKDTFHIEAGVELTHNVTVGYRHQSGASCGGPINNKPELYQDEIIVTKKWGGHK